MRGWKKDTVHILRKIGLKKRLFISFLLIAVFPMALVGTFMGKRLYRTSMENYEAQSVQTVKSLDYRITEKLNRDVKMMNDFASDLDVVKSVTKYDRETSGFDKTLLVKGMQTRLLSDLSQGRDGMRLEILNKNGAYITGIFEDKYRSVEEEARRSSAESEKRLTVSHIAESGILDSGRQTLVFSRQIINYFSGRTAGFVLMYQDMAELRREMKAVRSDILMAVFDEDGEIVCTGGAEEPYGPEAEKDIREAGQIFMNMVRRILSGRRTLT